MKKYQTLIQILDKLRLEAPKANQRYHPASTETEKLEAARARAFIHLYLKVKFGLLEFLIRESFITDDGGDAGIDAYFIDKPNRVVHVIQAKFRNNEKNFEEKEIEPNELLKMDVDRVVKGEAESENGTKYNGKVKGFQAALGSTELISQYTYKIIILANLKDLLLLTKLYPSYEIDVFDFSRSYDELVFPVVSGTYFRADVLHIKIDLTNTLSGHSRVSYSAAVGDQEVDVTLMFGPVREIGRIMSKYRNSILEFNPRSFLGLSKNSVNSAIEQSITATTSNEFALFNNGITIIADEAGYSDKTGKKSTAHLDLKNPQIINGGQTAFALCKIYDDTMDGSVEPNVFDGKEVLLKVITIDPAGMCPASRKALVEKISVATNHQTPVDEADRRSNEPIQIRLQALLYERYGLFYARKAGEFFDGINAGYVLPTRVVNREILMRIALASAFQVSETRTRIHNHFTEEAFAQNTLSEHSVDTYAFGFECLLVLGNLLSANGKKSADPYLASQCGSALRYGRYAVIAVAMSNNSGHEEMTPETTIATLLKSWVSFEKWVVSQVSNEKYFNKQRSMDWISYYKGATINDDLRAFFSK